MKETTQQKIDKVKAELDKRGIIYIERANGHLQIDEIDLWATSQKFYDRNTGHKGTGMNAFIKHLTQQNVV